MKNISISTFIKIIFLIAFMTITVSFVFFVKLDKEKYFITQHQRYDAIAEAFLQQLAVYPSQQDLNFLFNQFEVEEIVNREDKLNIINNAQLEFMKDSLLGRMRVFGNEGNFYVYVQRLSYNILVKDLKPKPYNSQVALIIYIVFLVSFYMLYSLLMRKLFPLKILNRQIEEFSNGSLDIKIDIVSNDEIGKIAKTFSNALQLIKNQQNSKNLFMRNMMHELRTPITKGMIIAETLPSAKDKTILQNAFERMNNIIKELSTVEKISSKILTIHKEKIVFDELYEKILKIMLLEELPIRKDFEDFELYVDIDLFVIALKNLLDNAIKFNVGDTEPLAVATSKEIKIFSYGKKLEKELEFYTEPFSQEEKRSDGFGLGLYIVKTIMELHGLKLEYEHKNNQNIFSIKLD